MSAVAERTLLFHEVRNILDSDLSDKTLARAFPGPSAGLSAGEPFNRMLRAAEIEQLSPRLYLSVEPLWGELRKFKQSVTRFRTDKIDAYPAWKFSDDPDGKVPVDLGNESFARVLGRSQVERWSRLQVPPLAAGRMFTAWQSYLESQDPSDESGGATILTLRDALNVFAELFGRSFKTSLEHPGTSLPFEVHTRGPDYQIQWTFQFWMSPFVFGTSLSTPVSGHLADNFYRFGGKKSGKPTIWDPGIYEVSATVREASLTAV